MAKIGYSRESWNYTIADQKKILLGAGCELFFEDPLTDGIKAEREGLTKAIQAIKTEDILMATDLSRFGRTTGGIVELISLVSDRGGSIQLINEELNTASPPWNCLPAFAEALLENDHQLGNERSLISLRIARLKNRVGGRPVTVPDVKLDLARELIASGISVRDAARRVDVSQATLYRRLGAKSFDHPIMKEEIKAQIEIELGAEKAAEQGEPAMQTQPESKN